MGDGQHGSEQARGSLARPVTEEDPVRRLRLFVVVLPLVVACAGGQSAGPATGSRGAGEASGAGDGGGEAGGEAGPSNEFQLNQSQTAGQAHGDHPSEIEATATHAALRLFVVNRDAGPIRGVVIKLTAPDGAVYYTGETDTQGYAEVLVPIGQRYDVEYLSLGRRNTTASVQVPTGPNQDIRLTMRYRRWRPPPRAPAAGRAGAPQQAEAEPPGFVLEDLLFATNTATIATESYPRLDRLVEFMTHRPSARIRISGHTDNVGNASRNQTLSEERARAVREYLVSHGIDGSRVEAVGFGDQRPVAPNDTEEGRARNRRIEAVEL